MCNYALYHLSRQFCTRHIDTVFRAQVLIEVNSSAVVAYFGRGRAEDRDAHTLLVLLFEFQADYDFLLSLKWIFTEENAVVDAISHPWWEFIIGCPWLRYGCCGGCWAHFTSI